VYWFWLNIIFTESTPTCPDKVVKKTTKLRVTLQQEQPLKMVEDIDRNM
jgi:hypothetical protein